MKKYAREMHMLQILDACNIPVLPNSKKRFQGISKNKFFQMTGTDTETLKDMVAVLIAKGLLSVNDVYTPRYVHSKLSSVVVLHRTYQTTPKGKELLRKWQELVNELIAYGRIECHR